MQIPAIGKGSPGEYVPGSEPTIRKVVSDEEFARWAESNKPCRYCTRNFVGPVCPHC